MVRLPERELLVFGDASTVKEKLQPLQQLPGNGFSQPKSALTPTSQLVWTAAVASMPSVSPGTRISSDPCGCHVQVVWNAHQKGFSPAVLPLSVTEPSLPEMVQVVPHQDQGQPS